jgi:hypothetical protein
MAVGGTKKLKRLLANDNFPSAPTITDSQSDFDVVKVTKKRIRKGVAEYQVKRAGHGW